MLAGCGVQGMPTCHRGKTEQEWPALSPLPPPRPILPLCSVNTITPAMCQVLIRPWEPSVVGQV